MGWIFDQNGSVTASRCLLSQELPIFWCLVAHSVHHVCEAWSLKAIVQINADRESKMLSRHCEFKISTSAVGNAFCVWSKIIDLVLRQPKMKSEDSTVTNFIVVP